MSEVKYYFVNGIPSIVYPVLIPLIDTNAANMLSKLDCLPSISYRL